MPFGSCNVPGKAATRIEDAHPAISARLIEAAKRLRAAVAGLEFSPPVSHTYNPLEYAWAPHESYLRRFANAPKRVVFLGMNPGPFGMAQTGVPFGEIAAVRGWLQLEAVVGKPRREHPRRPITGFACTRSEVSGRRLWGVFAARFRTPERFFAEHIVMNYCPLAFVETSGRNRTPDKLPAGERAALFAACDAHLRALMATLRPEWLIAVGDFAFKRAVLAFPNGAPRLGRILHPSPASPAANRDWAAVVTRQLEELGVWRAALSLAGRTRAGRKTQHTRDLFPPGLRG
jgi:single-strand selective monofunctional uracil DNA glycosylase